MKFNHLEMAKEFHRKLESNGLTRLQPNEGIHSDLITIIQDSLEQGHLTATAVFLQDDPVKTAIFEYLGSSGAYNAPGISPNTVVTVKNVGSNPISFIQKTDPVRMPRLSQSSAVPGQKWTQTNLGNEIRWMRTRATIEPGKTFNLAFTKAATLLTKYCKEANHPFARQMGISTPSETTLIEVGGYITVYRDGIPSQISWGELADSKKK